MAYPADMAPIARSAGRMASVRFPDFRSPAAQGMKRSLPYLGRQHFRTADNTLKRPEDGSNHHRYGEVKTRLTIGATGQFAEYYHIISRYYFWRAAMATKVTSKGQVTIPKAVRDHLGIVPGSEVAFRCAADGSIVIEKADGTQQPNRFAPLVGIAGPGPCTDEIMA